MSPIPTTYQDLLDIQKNLAQQGAVQAQTAANRASTLRAFLAFNHLAVDDAVGHEFRASFTACCQSFAVHLSAQGRTPRNVTNALAALRPWRKLLVAIDTERAISGDNLPPFNLAFRSLMEAYPVKRLARELSIPSDMLYGWLQGKRPRASNAGHIHRVEHHFARPHGELAVLAGIFGGTRLGETVGPTVKVEYRDGLLERTCNHYLFKPEVDSPLRRQWCDLLEYKTADDPELTRTEKGGWRKAAFEFRRQTEATWYQFHNGVEVPTAKINWWKTTAYLGWLQLPKAEGGAGLDSSVLHTMAWLAVHEHVKAYSDWLVQRMGGYNGSVFEFFSFVTSMLRADVGYLSQQPELLLTLPDEYHASDWNAMCSRTFTLLKKKSVRHRRKRKQSRDPKVPLAPILELENPLELVVDMVQRLRADRPLGGSPWREAVWARDLALIKLIVSNPLRLRNLATLTWREDNTGQLYQRAGGSWWIRIERENFKNVDGAAGDLDYDMPVQENVWTDLERYLKKFRPRLLRCDTDFVFLAGRSGSKLPRESVWADLSKRVTTLTRKYLWRCPGVGTHAFRHIVATAIIKASNLSDFKTAALVLNDRLSTVEKNYAHLRSSDGANRMAELLGQTLKKM